MDPHEADAYLKSVEGKLKEAAVIKGYLEWRSQHQGWSQAHAVYVYLELDWVKIETARRGLATNPTVRGIK